MSNCDLLNAATYGQAAVVENFLVLRQTDQELCDKALLCATENQHTDCLKILAPHCSQGVLNNVFKQAVVSGWVEGTEIMLAFVDGLVKNCGLEWSVANNGDCLNVLASVSDSRDLQDVFMLLVDGENCERVRTFLKYINPKHNNSEALQWASQIQCQEVFDLLYPVSDPQEAYTALQTLIAKRERIHGRPARQEIQMLEERIALEALNTQLNHEANRVWNGWQRERKI